MLGVYCNMPYATRKTCGFPGCDQGEPDDDGNPMPYITLEGIASRAEVSEELKEHVRMAHELIVEQKKMEVAKLQAEADKIRAETARVAAAHPPVQGQGLVPVLTEVPVAKEKRAVRRRYNGRGLVVLGGPVG